MAGVAGEQDSIHMNIQIQQVMQNLKHNFRWYVCDSNFKNATESAKATRTTLDYMAVAG
jgi:hypothetical protein